MKHYTMKAYRRKFRPGQAWALIALVFLLAAPFARAATVTWLPTGGTNDWFVETNWSSGTWPTNNDDVIITNTIAGNNFGVLLTNSTAALASILLSNTCMLIFSNWDTSLTASNVTVASNGLITLPTAGFANNAQSNNVVIVCTNLLINSSGKIDANGAGYKGGVNAAGHGPGGGNPYADSRHGPGGSYGGFGGASATSYGPYPYGSITAPLAPGSGGSGSSSGGTGGNGGGAIRIEAADLVTVNGIITANGANYSSGTHAGGGSGGGIYITCKRLAGTTGVILATGGSAVGAGGTGAGGRIAISVNAAAQQAEPRPTLALRPLPSLSGSYTPKADLGTLYLSDSSLLSEIFTSFTGQVYLGSSWTPGSLTISNSWVRFPENDFELRVTNNVTVIGSSARLDLGGNTYLRTDPTVFYSTNMGPRLYVGGNLILTNSGAMYIFSGMTNVVNTETGALVSVTGNMLVGAGSWVYVRSHVANGGSARFLMDSLVIAGTNAGFNADFSGFAGGNAPGVAGYIGLGPGRGYGEYRFMGTGGGYGGGGGRSSDGNPPSGYSGTNGFSNAPAAAGSGGGGRDVGQGGFGGGLIWIRAASSISQNGTITANGQTAPSSPGGAWGGGGSGGGVYLYTLSWSGTNPAAIVRANGGNAASTSYGGGGGGGRIAVWRRVDRHSYQGSYSVTNGTGYTTDAEVGTFFLGVIPPPGTIFTIH